MKRFNFLNVLGFVVAVGLVLFIMNKTENILKPKPIVADSKSKLESKNVFTYSPNKVQDMISSRIGKPKIELTLRMPLKKDMLTRIFCDLIRSTVLFWSPDYGDVVIILDNEDELQNFEPIINSIGLPNRFRIVYEKDFIRKDYIKEIGRKQDRPYGYLRMYYSSFIMDWYTKEGSIVGWTDSDTVFTIPVTDESIFRNGKLIVKGINQFSMKHIANWNQSTFWSIGLPMVSDFMSYFPTHVYASTLKNCRNHIMRRFNSTTFEEAYIKMIEKNAYISAVNVIFSYAYYFEKERYDWHIDIAPEKTLSAYNAKALPAKFPLLESDITPDLHVTVHTRHYRSSVKPIEQAICYSQMALGMTNIPHCDKFRNKINLQLFEFQSQQTHVNSWCGGEKRNHCKKIIDDRYKIWVEKYRKEGKPYNTSYIKLINDFALSKYGIKCYDFNYVPYS